MAWPKYCIRKRSVKHKAVCKAPPTGCVEILMDMNDVNEDSEQEATLERMVTHVDASAQVYMLHVWLVFVARGSHTERMKRT